MQEIFPRLVGTDWLALIRAGTNCLVNVLIGNYTLKQVNEANSSLLTLKEAAVALRLHPETVRRLVGEGKIPATRFGRSWRIQLEEVLAAGRTSKASS